METITNQTKKFSFTLASLPIRKYRQVRSIDEQISELRELAEKENIEIVDTLVEKQTAKIPSGPVFAEMLQRIEKGEAVGILARHPDKLALNSVDGGQIIYLVDTGVIRKMKFPAFYISH